ncbi:hypothetical protein D521_0445 [beta proteobacterium CB]|nr:hypothetical protein D521_0445 [beta proteobacterium CB]
MNQEKQTPDFLDFSLEALKKHTPIGRLTKVLVLVLAASEDKQGDAIEMARKLMAQMTVGDIEISKAKAAAIFLAL